MRNKNTLFIVAGLVMVAGVLLVVDQFKKAPPPQDPRIGTHLFDSKLAGAVSKVELKKKDHTLVLSCDDKGGWSIEGGDRFPAAATNLMKLMDDLSASKFIRVVEGSKEKFAELALDQENKVVLYQAAAPVLELLVGSQRKGDGQFIALAGENKAYLIDRNITVDTNPASWELKELVNVEKDLIKKVAFFSRAGAAAPAVAVAREKKEDAFKVEGTTDKEKIKTYEIDALGSILSHLSYDKKLRQSEVDPKLWSEAPFAAISTFDNAEFVVKIAKKQQPKAQTPAAAAADKKKPAASEMETTYLIALEIKGDGKSAAGASLIKELSQQWAFQIPEYVANKFLKDRASFVEKS
jgi:hypothetical protein